MMKIVLSSLLLVLSASAAQDVSQTNTKHRKLAVEMAEVPIQTFYLPFKEDDLFNNLMMQINSGRARAPVTSTFSIAFSTPGTIVWFDHWEDGYELDATAPTQSTTEIWGDNNAANGCPPKVVPCTNANDFLNSGSSIVMENNVTIPRILSERVYDGGDRIQVNFPVTVVRGAYPATPGSLMAGSTDMIEVENWGKKFMAPTGQDVGTTWNVFEYTGLFFMAANDNTTVTLPNGTQVLLNRGDSSSVRVNQGATLEANDIIQVHLITGDIMSFYEMRWFSLLPNDDWSSEYLSPVGDTHGKTKLFLYNPASTTAQISYDILRNVSNVFTRTTITASIAPKKSMWTDVIPTGSGALVKTVGGTPFLALSLTDTENRTVNQWTFSEWYDWGFTVLPTNILTSQVLIGWGYACTNNNCYGQVDRSVIWVTPMEDCDIYIDYKNTGTNRSVFPRKALTSSKFVDIDQDMSGALLFATAPNSGVAGRKVKFAAAWGQDPSVSFAMQSISLDLGTVIRPFPEVRANKYVDKPVAKPGEILTYTIKLLNAGQVDLPSRSLRVFDTLDPMVSYVPNSTNMTYNIISGGVASVATAKIPDSATGTPYPFDGSGQRVDINIPKRGGAVDITFQVKIDRPITSLDVINRGEVVEGLNSSIPFDATTQLLLDPKIALDNKVYLGSDNGGSCGTDAAKEYVEDIAGAGVVYCFNITNTGDTYLANFTLGDAALLFTNQSNINLAPGNSTMVYFKSKINQKLLNMANVTATPTFVTGQPVPGLPKVNASDPSEVGILIPAPSISIVNKVAQSTDKAVCGTSLPVEYVENYVGTNVTYCFNITNTGNTYLDSVSVDNKELVFTNSSIGKLAPGEWKMLAVPGSIANKLLNNATVKANPVYKDGTDIPSLADVTASDPSEVGVIIVTPSVNIENTVHLGKEEGRCNTAVEVVEGPNGNDVTYCFVVTNTGNSYLNITSVTDPVLNFTQTKFGGLLAPNASITITYKSSITGAVVNNATVLANPVTPEGKDIPFLNDVTDSDPSEVKEVVAPKTPPTNNTCLDNAYADAFNLTDQLVCTSSEVYLEKIDSVTAKTCKAGDTITIDLKGSIRIISARFDIGWYVAVDGGDALDGNCSVNGLQQGTNYSVVNMAGGNKTVGAVTWGSDAAGGKDVCGDVSLTVANSGGTIDTSIGKSLTVPCKDETKDGKMDIAICFTWRTEDTDGACTLDHIDPKTKGRLADLYPGSVKGCYCERYDLPNITVTPPPKVVPPC